MTDREQIAINLAGSQAALTALSTIRHLEACRREDTKSLNAEVERLHAAAAIANNTIGRLSHTVETLRLELELLRLEHRKKG